MYIMEHLLIQRLFQKNRITKMATNCVLNSQSIIYSHSFPPYKKTVYGRDTINRTHSATSLYGPIQFQFGGSNLGIVTPRCTGVTNKCKPFDCTGNSENERLISKPELFSNTNLEPNIFKLEPNGSEEFEPPKLSKITRKYSKSVPSFNQFGTETETEVKQKKRRKSVTFADFEGMELTEVFYFKPFNILSNSDGNQEEIEVLTNFETNLKTNKQINYTTNFLCDNKNPKFVTFLQTNNVALETISVDWNFIKGWIHVLNIEFHKKVSVRWTEDDWLTKHNTEAEYEYSLKSVFVDVFVFKIPVKMCRIEFAICYATCGQEFWDNNSGNNYAIKCYF